MKFSLFFFPSLGMGDPRTYERKNIGNDPEQFAYLLEDLKLMAQTAEDAGFHGVYFAEHHFDSEGFEASHNPLLFDLWVAMHTKRIKVGQLGFALPNWNPLRLAEDIATATHMLGDRLELGFVRGFQTREVAPLAAAHQVEGALSDHSEADQRNRRLFTENYRILMKALTEDFISYEGEFNTIPPKGLMWTNPATQKYGGGVAPDGTVTHLAVVPKPRKIPPRWQAFSFSEETMRFAGQEGMNVAMGHVLPALMRKFQEVFLEESQKAGRNIKYGDGVGYLRGMLCHEDPVEARRLDEEGTRLLWGDWFAGIGFTELFRTPDDPTDRLLDYSYDILNGRGFSYAGTPDEITRRIEEFQEVTHAEHMFFYQNSGTVPRGELLRSLELFAEKVMPRFDVGRPKPAAAEVGIPG